MTGAQTSLLPPTASDERAEETDTAERCDDPTPRGIFRALLPEAIGDFAPMWNVDASDHLDGLGYRHPGEEQSRVTRVLDVGAGYGGISSELRRHANRQGWPVHITGVEIHAAREEFGRRWCDEWLTCDWHRASEAHAAYSMDPASDAYDLAIGNPPFDELTGPKGAKRPPEECMPAVLLRHAPAVLLLHQTQSFQRSEAGRASWRHNPPAASWLVPGNVGFRGPGHGNDTRCYQVTLWLRDHTGPCSVHMLDDLPPSARSWTVPPGTELPSKCESCGGSGDAGNVEWVEWSDAGMPMDAPGRCSACDGSGLDPNGDLPGAPGSQP